MPIPLSNLSTTWATSGTTSNTAIKMNVNDVASASTSKLMDLQVNGISKFNVDKNGKLIVDSIQATTYFGLSGYATVSYVNSSLSNYVSKSGDTMTGSLTMTNNGATPVVYAGISVNGGDISVSTGGQFLGRGNDGQSTPSYSWSSYPNTGLFIGSNGTAIGLSILGTQTGRLTSSEWLVGETTIWTVTSTAKSGCALTTSGSGYFYTSGTVTPLEVSVGTAGNILTNWRVNGTQEGSVSVGTGTAGTRTVTYGPFLGSHWATLKNRETPEILSGTILETIDELVDWKYVIANDEETDNLKIAYNGLEPVGSTVDFTYKDKIYTSVVYSEVIDDGNVTKHVKVKISDQEESRSVFGVFLGWDNVGDDQELWDGDMFVASVGNYFIRISKDYQVAMGDLIVSNGDGTGRPQSDDIIRSKTVGKITSTKKQVVYDDGSYLVTAVLYCG